MEGNNNEAGSSTNNIDLSYNESALSKSEYLTRQEVMKRRASRLRRLAKCYRDHYWLLMEEVRKKYRDFVWKYGKDYENGADNGGDIVNNNNNNNNHSNIGGGGDELNNNGGKLGFGDGSFNRCNFPNCKSKAMAMTSYCHSHILSDSKQLLYTKCHYAHKCGPEPILCGKPVLRSTIPPMCASHIKTTKQTIQRALKKHGAPGAASNRLAAKFHVVLTEYVRLIQNKRRARRQNSIAMDEDTT